MALSVAACLQTDFVTLGYPGSITPTKSFHSSAAWLTAKGVNRQSTPSEEQRNYEHIPLIMPPGYMQTSVATNTALLSLF